MLYWEFIKLIKLIKLYTNNNYNLIYRFNLSWQNIIKIKFYFSSLLFSIPSTKLQFTNNSTIIFIIKIITNGKE